MSKTAKTISQYLLGGALGLSIVGNLFLASNLMLKEAKLEELQQKIESPAVVKATINGVDYLIDKNGNHFEFMTPKVRTIEVPDATYYIDAKNNYYKEINNR